MTVFLGKTHKQKNKFNSNIKFKLEIKSLCHAGHKHQALLLTTVRQLRSQALKNNGACQWLRIWIDI